MIEILHFCPSHSFSGLEQYALGLAQDQKNKGRSVAFVVAPGSPLEKNCKTEGIPTISYEPIATFGNLRFWPRLVGLLRHEKSLKVIHLHSTQEVYHLSGALFIHRLMRPKRSPKIVLQIHIWINHNKKDPLHRFLYSLVDEVWCSSEPAKKTLLNHLPVAENKIKVIKYGRAVGHIEENLLSRNEARSHLKIPPDSTVIGTVSRFEKSKGIQELLDASIALLNEDAKLHLVVIGGPSPQNPEAERYAENINQQVSALPQSVKERVHLPGMLLQSYKFLRAFDLYILPSYEECFSLSLLDAQLAGLPVVGSQSGGTPEIVREGETGFLFEPRDTDSLKDKLREALHSQERWPSYGDRARERVKTEFDQERVFDSILEEYEAAP